MLGKVWPNLRRLLPALLVGVAVASGGVASAQDADVKALLERLERLEKQNDELRTRLDSSPVAVQSMDLGQKDVEKIVGDFLKKSKADEKKAEADKAKEFQEVGSDLNVKAKFKDGGVYFETPLKDFKFHVGGRVHYDIGFHDPDPEANFPPFHDASGFRRARLRADGTMWEVFSYVAEFEFAGGTVAPTDVYIDVNQLPILGTFRAGHFKQFFSLDELTSSRYQTFMDKTLFNEAFGLGRRLGVGVIRTYAEDRGTVAAGAFRNEAISLTDFGDGEYNYSARATILPVWQHEGRCLVHLGAAYMFQGNTLNPAADQDGVVGARYRARTLRIGDGSGTPRILQAGPLAVEHAHLFGGEAAVVWGPLSVQGEVAYLQNDNIVGGAFAGREPNYWGSYLQVSYFLTGEHRPYKKETGTFDRVKPNEPFFLVKGEHGEKQFGRGAWELCARWDYLDLRDDGVVSAGNPPTGILQDVVFGVNWYWTSNAKVMFNYVHAWRDSDAGDGIGANRSGDVDSIGVRFAWDF